MKSGLSIIIILFGLFHLAEIQAQVPVFHKDIAPIIHQNCTPCHQKGGVAPFQLLQYDDVAQKAALIAQVTSDRYMPPWPADIHGQHYQNERILTHNEIETIRKWVAAGSPEGKPKTFRLPREAKPKEGQIVWSPASPFEVKGTNEDQYAFFLLPDTLVEDLPVTAIRFVPGNKKIVHHCELLAVRKEAIPTDLPQKVVLPSYFPADFNAQFAGGISYIAGWLPGNQGEIYPRKSGMILKREMRYILMVHYAPFPTDQQDLTTIEITPAKKAPRRPISSIDLHGAEHIQAGDLAIPADTVITFHATRTVEQDFSAISIYPHAHHLAVAMRAAAVLPGNDTIKLLNIPEWDFNWQYNYRFPTHVYLPEKTKIHFWVTYDNTSQNPENPYHPPRLIPNSFNANDEMMELFIWGYPYQPKDERKSVRYPR